MKNKRCLLSCFIMIFTIMITLRVYAADSFFIGGGTEDSPFLISNANQLVQLATLVNTGNTTYNNKVYQLNNDIDMTEISNWTPIGVASPFYGDFDGLNHQIKNLSINITYNGEIEKGVGLFDLNSGNIKNLQLTNSQFNINGDGYVNVGGISVINNGVIDNCSVDGIIALNSTIKDSKRVGGISYENNGIINNCSNKARISSIGHSAGIVVWNRSSVSSCVNKGIINGSSASGIALVNCSKIIESKNFGAINAVDVAGGITMNNDSGTISKCLNSGTVLTNATNESSRVQTGGIAAVNYYGKINECVNTGIINTEGTTKEDSHPGSSVGGIVGVDYAGGEIKNCYNSGSVHCNYSKKTYMTHAGGIVGYFYGSIIQNCYNTGVITGVATSNGGIVGTDNGVLIDNCYYVNNISDGIGYDYGNSENTVESFMLQQMYQPSTFVGFDFNSIWVMPENVTYTPVLRSIYVPLVGIRLNDSLLVTGEKKNIQTLNPTNATINECAWSNYDPSIISIDAYGNVTALKVGTTTVIGTSKQGGYFDTCTITVQQGVTNINTPQTLSLPMGETSLIKATVSPSNAVNKLLNWTSSNQQIAKVDHTGLVTAILPGTTTIIASSTDGSGIKMNITLTVIYKVTGVSIVDSATSIKTGNTLKLSSTITPSNASNQNVNWKSSDPAIATISTAGEVTGISRGTVTITVTTVDGGFESMRVLEVVQPVAEVKLNTSSTGVATGQKIQLIATILPENANNQNVIWSSNSEQVATVSSKGLVTGVSAGSASIQAKSEDGGYVAYCILTVGAGVEQITIDGPDEVTNQTATYSASTMPATAVNKTVTWGVIPGTGKAIITATGVLTGTSGGTVMVQATACDGTGIMGSKTVTIKEIKPQVQRLAGLNRIETSIAIAKEQYTDSEPDSIVLATANNFADALAGSGLSYKYNGPLLLVNNTVSNSKMALEYIKTNLSKNKTVYILGGTVVVSKEISDYLTTNGYKIVRLGGKDRYETNQKIVDYLNIPKGTSIVIATGDSFADALSISSIADIKGYPILLNGKDNLLASVSKDITITQPKTVYIIGGTGVLSINIERQIKLVNSNITIVRLGGKDRYETSMRIMEYFNLTTDTITVATGIDFPDALSGSVLAARKNCGVLLIDNKDISKQKELLNKQKITNVIVFGGESVISRAIANSLIQK